MAEPIPNYCLTHDEYHFSAECPRCKPPVEGGETATLRRQIGVCEDCGRHGALPGGKCGACKAIWDLCQQIEEKDARICELEEQLKIAVAWRQDAIEALGRLIDSGAGD